MNIETLKKEFSARANEEKANHLVGYMQNQFLFYGLQTPERRAIYHNFLKDEKKKKEVDWKLLDQAWDEEQRELQYFACDYLLAMKKYIVFDDLAKIERFVRTKQWWDTIDSLIKIYGYVGLTDNRVDDLMPVSYTHLRAHETHRWISYAVFCLKKKKKNRWDEE